MFSTLRTRFGIPGVISVIALVFAMTGGAFAAKYLITSTKQIKPSVLTALKGKAGPPGAPGAVGPQGPAGANGKNGANGTNGADGATGPKGATGATGTNGTNGATGATGPTGAAGKDATFEGKPLAPGVTLTGTWGGFHQTGFVDLVPISFPVPLPADLNGFGAEPANHTHYVPALTEGKLTVPPPACDDGVEPPPNWAHPEADPGNLCVFQRVPAEPSIFVKWISKPTGNFEPSGASTTGAILALENTEGTVSGKIYGTWAVTAPTGP